MEKSESEGDNTLAPNFSQDFGVREVDGELSSHQSHRGSSSMADISTPQSSMSYSNQRFLAREWEEIPSPMWLNKSVSNGSENDSPLTRSSLDSALHDQSTLRVAGLYIYGDAVPNTDITTSYASKTDKKDKVSIISKIPKYFKFWGRRKNRVETRRDQEASIDEELMHQTGCRRFTFKELLIATNKFSSNMLLGKGGFGVVYRGFLSDLRINVAIKRLSMGVSHGADVYISEISVISQLRHRNLVLLLGWCHEKDEFLVVYELMPNGSLDSHLYSMNNLLPWGTRYKIAVGLASALHYLQEEWEQCVVHRDVKPSNVLLDEEFNAKLSDFGIARLLGHDNIESVTTEVKGTVGYIAPEYFITGKTSKESDIYCFGIVVLEIACGRKNFLPRLKKSNMRLVEWVTKLYKKGMILEAADEKLGKEFDRGEMERLMLVGLWCVHIDPKMRPSIKQVVRILTFEESIPTFTPNMTAPIYIPATISAESHQSTTISSSTDEDIFSQLGESPDTTIHFSIPEPRSAAQVRSTISSKEVGTQEQHLDVDIRNLLSQQAEAFDIGIPPNYNSSAAKSTDHQLLIIKGLLASLHGILKLEPQFNVVLESIKRFTEIIVMVAAPLDEWNTLAQYVLRAQKEIDSLKMELKEEGIDCSISTESISILKAEIGECAHTIEEDATELENTNQQLVHAKDELLALTSKFIDLQKQLADVQNQIEGAEAKCFSLQEEIKLIDSRKAQQLLILGQKKRQYAVSTLSETILSKVSSFP